MPELGQHALRSGEPVDQGPPEACRQPGCFSTDRRAARGGHLACSVPALVPPALGRAALTRPSVVRSEEDLVEGRAVED